MTHASIFSGIGGFDLAAEWAGWMNAFNCEIDSFCRKVLKYHFPNAEQYEDIKKSDFSKWRDCIDVLTGGFPCQPFSLAGKRKGTEDDRYLWPAMLGVIRTIRPRWVVGENVYGIVNWSDGLVFDTVCSDLEAAGYEVQPYIIPACGVGAPHRRDRVWFVAHYKKDYLWQRDSGEELRTFAHRADTGLEKMREGKDGIYADESVAHAECFGGREIQDQIQSEQPKWSGINCYGSERNAPDHDCDKCRIGTYQPKSDHGSGRKTDDHTYSEERYPAYTYVQRFEKCNASEKSSQTQERLTQNGNEKRRIPDWSRFPTESPVRRKYDGISNNVVRYIENEVYEELYKHYGGEDLPGLRQAFQQEEIRKEVGRLYEIPQPDILLQVLQRTSQAGGYKPGTDELSPYSKETSERVLRYLRNNRKLASSSFGQKYKEQFRGEFTDALRELSHEIALATKKIVEECERTASWVMRESIKACGNAIVPQVALQIFKTIEEYETKQLR